LRLYPPLRDTLLTLDEQEMVLYTRGSVPFFETYPGKYIPRPLRIHADSTEQTPQYLAREILALTKMNWNNTQFDGAEPVTLRASRQCSSVLRYCSEARHIEPRYSYYRKHERNKEAEEEKRALSRSCFRFRALLTQDFPLRCRRVASRGKPRERRAATVSLAPTLCGIARRFVLSSIMFGECCKRRCYISPPMFVAN
jgi:hypothetical protein